MDVEFSNSYKHIQLSYSLLQKFTGKTSDPVLKQYVDKLRIDVVRFLEYEFYPDPDIDLLKHMAFDILKQLDNFK